jgi:hypothetical protein
MLAIIHLRNAGGYPLIPWYSLIDEISFSRLWNFGETTVLKELSIDTKKTGEIGS